MKNYRKKNNSISGHIARVLSILMILSLLTGGIVLAGEGPDSAYSYAASQTENDYEYTVSGGSATLTSYNGSEAEPVIPASIGGYKVTAIGPACFRGNSKIRSIKVPEGVTEIGDYAFEACSAATELVLPSSLETIGKSAFSGDALLEEVIIPAGVRKIGDGAFLYCKRLVKVTGGEGLTEMGQFVFAGCEEMTDVHLGSSKLKAIPDRSFCNCYDLSVVELPDSVETLGKRAFSNCSSLEAMEFGPALKTVGDYVFEKCESLKEVTFEGTGGLKLGRNVFDNPSGMTAFYLRLPDNTEITENSFANASIEGVYISGEGRLKSASGSELVIIDGQIYEEDGAVLVNTFSSKYDKAADEWVAVTETVSGAKPFTRYTVRPGVRRIGAEAFGGKTFGNVVIPASVEKIDDHAFFESRVKTVTVSGDNSKYAEIDGILYEKAGSSAADEDVVVDDSGEAGSPAVEDGNDASVPDNNGAGTGDDDSASSGDNGSGSDRDSDAAGGGNDAAGSVPDDQSGSDAAGAGDISGVSSSGTAGLTFVSYRGGTDTDPVQAGESDAAGGGNDAAGSGSDDQGGSDAAGNDGSGSDADVDDAGGDAEADGAAGEEEDAAADTEKYRLVKFFSYKLQGNDFVKTTVDGPNESYFGPRQLFDLPDNVVSIAPYAFYYTGIDIRITENSSLESFEEYSFMESGIKDPRTQYQDDKDYLAEIIIPEEVLSKISVSDKAFLNNDFFVFPFDDDDFEEDPGNVDPEDDPDSSGDDTYDQDFNDRFARIRDDRRTEDGDEPDLPEGNNSGTTDFEVTCISESGDKSLYSEEAYSNFHAIPNDEFIEWTKKYLDYNKELNFSAETMPYVMLYKGEAHYRSMVCVLNHDQYKTDYSIASVGDDFAPMYLAMDHGLEAEMERGGIPDDMVLYSGITVERMADIVGASDKTVKPTKEQLIGAIGREFTDPAFMSTTTNPGTAVSFSSHSDTVVIIYASSESLTQLGAVCIDGFAGWGAGEYEILLNLGAKFKVLDVGTMTVSADGDEFSNERTYIRLELIGPDPDNDPSDDPSDDPSQDPDADPSGGKTVPAPSAIYTTAKTGKKMYVNWPAVSGAASYKLQYRKAGASKWNTVSVSGTSRTLTGMKGGSMYEFRVASVGSNNKTGKYTAPAYRFYKQTTGVKCKARKAAVKVKWKKTKGASGYQILVSENKDLKGAKIITVKGGKKKSRVIKSLKSGKTYYVAVRPYKNKGGNRYIGIRSKIRKVKVK